MPLQLGSVVYPLLAPALMEALRTSEFAQVTQMVPGEADEWCASKARDNPRSIIFTSDTDLLLYDYPAELLVNFLRDGDILPEGALKVYSPTRICEQLKLRSLVQLAYAIQTDRWKSLTEISREARNHASPTSMYADFNRRYILQAQTPSYLQQNSRLDAALQGLDARISEFVLQTLSPTDDAPLALPVFLPLFMEDPFQASAWKQGQDLRVLAYSLLAPRRVVILEHVRKAQGIFVQELDVRSPGQTTTRATELADLLLTSPVDRELAGTRYWTLVAVQLALNSLKPPHVSLLTRVVTGDFDNTWSFIHLLACIQATLYSLRILKQCVSIWLTLHVREDTEDDSVTLYQTIYTLHKALASLPTIAELFTVPGQAAKSQPQDASIPILLKSIYTAAGVDNEELFQEAKSKRQRKRDKRERKAKKVQIESEQGDADPANNNVFAILNSGT
jgi:hypothetical protein